MMCDIPINLVYEDILSEAVLRKLITNSRKKYQIGISYNAYGCGRIKNKINGFNNAAKGMPYLVLTDLDEYECPPVLISHWFAGAIHNNLLFRVAVREVEAWLLACRNSFATYLGVSENKIPADVDAIQDTKQFLVNLAKRSRKRRIKLDIVPQEGSTAKVGPAYNDRLVYYVENIWDVATACQNSLSLRKAVAAIDNFLPVFGM
jgi:hypothetical protein